MRYENLLKGKRKSILATDFGDCYGFVTSCSQCELGAYALPRMLHHNMGTSA